MLRYLLEAEEHLHKTNGDVEFIDKLVNKNKDKLRKLASHKAPVKALTNFLDYLFDQYTLDKDYKWEVDFTQSKRPTDNPRWASIGIDRAGFSEASPGVFKVKLHVAKDFPSKFVADLNTTAEVLKEFLAHEAMHFKQYRKLDKKSKKAFWASGTNEKDYLKDKYELAAYAQTIVQEFQHAMEGRPKGEVKKMILAKIQHPDDDIIPDKMSPTFVRYKKAFSVEDETYQKLIDLVGKVLK